MIKVRVGAFIIGKVSRMADARQLAASHVIGLVMNGELATGEAISVEYRLDGQVLEASEMLGPDLNGSLLVI